jgi:hypothetical protein
MKYIKYIDFGMQTLVMVAGVGYVICSIGDVDFLLAVLCVQFILGSWQMLSSFLSVVTRAPLWKLKLFHFLIAICYLALLTLVVNSISAETTTYKLIFIIPAWLLASFYYALTWRWALTNTKRGSFLPNLSF